jgi:hypothetical protein
VFFARGAPPGSKIIPGELGLLEDFGRREWLMTLGLAPRQADLFRTTAAYCDGRVAAGSISGILHRECFALFPDEMFADLFDDVGRRSVPPMIVAVVMVLQRIEGLSDREAVDRFSFDARWKYAVGGLDFGYPGFVHTVLVDMRARLARSERPDRIFEVTLGAARRAGLVGRAGALWARRRHQVGRPAPAGRQFPQQRTHGDRDREDWPGRPPRAGHSLAAQRSPSRALTSLASSIKAT